MKEAQPKKEMDQLDNHFFAWPEVAEQANLGSIELPGRGSFVFALQRHSSFSRNKYPSIERDGQSTGEIAQPTIPEDRSAGYYGPANDKAEGVALTIPGLTDAKGDELTERSGRDFAELLASDNIPTHVIVVYSPSRWPNEEVASKYNQDGKKRIEHEFGVRTATTGASFLRGLESIATTTDNITFDSIMLADPRLEESGYQYAWEEGKPGSNRHYDLLADISSDIHTKEGSGKDNPNRYFIEGHPLLSAAALALGTRDAKKIQYDIEELFTEIYYSPRVQEMMNQGIRVVVVGQTHAQTAKAFMHQSLGDDSKLPTPGYRDSEMVIGTYNIDETRNLTPERLGYTSYK